MTTSAPTAGEQQQQNQTGRYKRSVRNYLIDSRFQLKYTGILVGVALVITGVLGFFLWRTSRDVVETSNAVVSTGNKLTEESKKVSEISKMQITNFVGDDPAAKDLMKTFTEESSAYDKKIEDQQKALADQQKQLLARQNTMLYALIGGLALMVALIGMLGIYFTHKVAGPIFKMKRLLRQVGEGKLTIEGRLRKGDELHDFFETFETMVKKLRERQSREVEELEKAIEIAKKSGASAESVAKVSTVRDEMKRALEA
jgi:methyl-accepting chemotaxis protein